MSNVKNSTKMKSFVKQFIALVEGDSAEATAQKVLRQADSALSTHTSILQGDLVSKEDAVTEAKEALDMARVNNGKVITNRDQYVSNLLDARNRLVDAEEALELHKAKLEFLTNEKDSLDSEV